MALTLLRVPVYLSAADVAAGKELTAVTNPNVTVVDRYTFATTMAVDKNMGLLDKDAIMYDEEPVYLTVAQKTERKMRLEHVSKQRAALAGNAYEKEWDYGKYEDRKRRIPEKQLRQVPTAYARNITERHLIPHETRVLHV